MFFSYFTTQTRRAEASLAPRFVQKPRSTEVVEGDSLVVVCEVVGEPKPEVNNKTKKKHYSLTTKTQNNCFIHFDSRQVIWLRDWLNVSVVFSFSLSQIVERIV